MQNNVIITNYDILELLIITNNYLCNCHDAYVVPASGSEQLQANPPMAGPTLFLGKPTQKTVTTTGSNDLVESEDHLLSPSVQQYKWQTDK